MTWNELSIAQRSQIMNIMRQNGITDLHEMRRVYDAFSDEPDLQLPKYGNPYANVYAPGGPLSFKDFREGKKGSAVNVSPSYGRDDEVLGNSYTVVSRREGPSPDAEPVRYAPKDVSSYGEWKNPSILEALVDKESERKKDEPYNIFKDPKAVAKREAHLRSLDAFIKDNPSVAGLNTAQFRDLLSAFSGLEGSYDSLSGKGMKYSGYYGLENGRNYSPDAQHRMAYEHLASLFKHNITKDDLQKGIEKGYTPAQVLYKYWNQQNHATEFLQNGIDHTEGNNPPLGILGNQIEVDIDYSDLIPEANKNLYRVIQKGDVFSTLQERSRYPGRHYDVAGNDLAAYNPQRMIDGKLSIGDTLWFGPKEAVLKEHQFDEGGKTILSKDDYYRSQGIEPEYYDTLNASGVTASLPSINTPQGKRLASRMASNISVGNMDAANIPAKYNTYIQGELKGAQPVRDAINTTGVKTALATAAVPAAVIGAAETAPFIGAAADWLGGTQVGQGIGHVMNVLGNPMAAKTTAGSIAATAADLTGFGSGIAGGAQKIDKALAGDFTWKDVPETLMDMSVALPGSSALTKYAPEMLKGASELSQFYRGLPKRLAEEVVRIGDNASSPSYVKKQVFSKNGMNYLFNPKASPDIAYNLPYTYSGESSAALSTAHHGDIVDQYFGKVPVPNATYDLNTIPEGMRNYISKNYAGKQIPVRHLEGTMTPYESLTGHRDVMNKVYNPDTGFRNALEHGKKVHFGSQSQAIMDSSGKFVLDPGGHQVFGVPYGRDLQTEHYDIWKFNPKDYSNRYLGDNTSFLKRMGLKFIDNQGTPIVHHWSQQYKNVLDPYANGGHINRPFLWYPGMYADGGNIDRLFYPYPGIYGKGGKIHIKPSKRGTFTAAAKKHGKSVAAFAAQVLAHPENYSPAMRKKANFARNARRWRHALGGGLYEVV